MTTTTQSALYPADNPAVTAHINMLQGIINRLANNSSSCKTWCVALVGGFLSLTGATHVAAIATFALVPVVIFGFVDMMYLAQEKAYRDLYDTVVATVRDGSYQRGCVQRQGPAWLQPCRVGVHLVVDLADIWRPDRRLFRGAGSRLDPAARDTT